MNYMNTRHKHLTRCASSFVINEVLRVMRSNRICRFRAKKQ